MKIMCKQVCGDWEVVRMWLLTIANVYWQKFHVANKKYCVASLISHLQTGMISGRGQLDEQSDTSMMGHLTELIPAASRS